MVRPIEFTHEDTVLKPVEKIPLVEGERIWGTIEKKLNFEPKRLKKKLSSERISALRAESWTSSTHIRIF